MYSESRQNNTLLLSTESKGSLSMKAKCRYLNFQLCACEVKQEECPSMGSYEVQHLLHIDPFNWTSKLNKIVVSRKVCVLQEVGLTYTLKTDGIHTHTWLLFRKNTSRNLVNYLNDWDRYFQRTFKAPSRSVVFTAVLDQGMSHPALPI